MDNGVAAPKFLNQLSPTAFLRHVTIFGNRKHHNHELHAWLAAHRPSWRLEVKMRPEGTQGLTPLEKRWVMERINAWNGRY
jgi:hypothetical protein